MNGARIVAPAALGVPAAPMLSGVDWLRVGAGLALIVAGLVVIVATVRYWRGAPRG